MIKIIEEDTVEKLSERINHYRNNFGMRVDSLIKSHSNSTGGIKYQVIMKINENGNS